jgi:hypothetical protein
MLFSILCDVDGGELAMRVRRRIGHDGINVAHERHAQYDVSDIRICMTELGIGGLNKSYTELCAVVFGRFGSEVERMKRDFLSIVETDGHVEWCVTGYIV